MQGTQYSVKAIVIGLVIIEEQTIIILHCFFRHQPF